MVFIEYIYLILGTAKPTVAQYVRGFTQLEDEEDRTDHGMQPESAIVTLTFLLQAQISLTTSSP